MQDNFWNSLSNGSILQNFEITMYLLNLINNKTCCTCFPTKYFYIKDSILLCDSFRSELDLFASIVHCKSIAGVPTRHSDVDFIIVRENTEGEYSGLEHEVRIMPCQHNQHLLLSFNPRNFPLLEVVSRWRDPQLQVSENYSDLTKLFWNLVDRYHVWSFLNAGI